MMRRQAFEWRGVVPSATWPEPYTLNLQPILTASPVVPQIQAHYHYDIFTGGLGTILDIPGFIKATQFVVIDEISCWPPQSKIQPWVDNTRYFQEPDNSTSIGLDGWAIPFLPGGGSSYSALGIYNHFSFKDSPIYVNPGQTWGVYWLWDSADTVTIPTTQSAGVAPLTVNYTTGPTTVGGVSGDLLMPRVYLEYILYDGADALIAHRLVSQGESVSVAKVEAYKRAMIRFKLMADIVDAEDSEIKTVPRKFA